METVPKHNSLKIDKKVMENHNFARTEKAQAN